MNPVPTDTQNLKLGYNKQLNPEISHYIVLTLLKSVFNKYEKENEIADVTILISKINLINNNLQDLLYLLFTVFFPRILVLFFNCYQMLEMSFWGNEPFDKLFIF